MDCIFCKIVSHELPAKILYESDNLVAFPDIHPLADTHIVIIPKTHIANISEAQGNGELLSEVFQTADKLAEENDLKKRFYRILVNGGNAQHVPHLHFHLLGGNYLKWEKEN